MVSKNVFRDKLVWFCYFLYVPWWNFPAWLRQPVSGFHSALHQCACVFYIHIIYIYFSIKLKSLRVLQNDFLGLQVSDCASAIYDSWICSYDKYTKSLIVSLYPPLQWSWKGYWFHLVQLSVCGQNRVRSVSSAILIGSILYLYILSSNFRRCVVCNGCFKIQKF